MKQRQPSDMNLKARCYSTIYNILYACFGRAGGDMYILTSSHPFHNFTATSSASTRTLSSPPLHPPLFRTTLAFQVSLGLSFPNPFHSYPPPHIFSGQRKQIFHNSSYKVYPSGNFRNSNAALICRVTILSIHELNTLIIQDLGYLGKFQLSEQQFPVQTQRFYLFLN